MKTNNQNRPKIKIEPSQTDRFIEAGSILLVIATWVIAVLNFSHLPEIIPSHAGISGEIDGYSSRISVFFIPVLTTITFVTLMILGRYPHVYNYPLEVTEETAPRVYAFSMRMVKTLNFIVALMFFFTEYMIIRMAYGDDAGFALWMIIAFVLVMIDI